MTTQPAKTEAKPTHSELRAALYPVALRAVWRGDFAECMGSHMNHAYDRTNWARNIADASARDLILFGKAVMLRADEVEAVLLGIGITPGIKDVRRVAA